MASGKSSNAADANQKAIDKRRARNRVSQKSFRERQGLYVKQLEKQLGESSRTESARVLELQQECETLRLALLAARKRIRGLNTALGGVSDNIGATLGLKSANSGTTDSGEDAERDVSGTPSCEEMEGKMSTSDIHEAQEVGNESSLLLPQDVIDTQSQMPTAHEILQSNLPSSSIALPESNLLQHMQGLYWPFDTGTFISVDAAAVPCTTPSTNSSVQYRVESAATGSEQPHSNQPSDVATSVQRADLQKRPGYSDIFNVSSGSMLQEPNILSDLQMFPPGSIIFPSSASAHLAACEFFIKHNRAYKQRRQPRGSEALTKLISNMVNMFINTAWPEMRVWWAYMQSSAAVEKIMRWRLDPSLESYQDLKPCHRPTTTQLCIVHPPIIDWGFFPSIRDKMIELYSYSWAVDDLMFEMLNAYVVETELAGIVSGLSEGLPSNGYFRIWDVVQTISNEDDEPESINGMSFWQEGNAFEATNDPSSPFQIDEDGEREEWWTPLTLEEIYHSKKAAQKLFRKLQMDDRTKVKIDPAFVAKHPELCDDPSILASGVDCTNKSMAREVPRMKPLTRETIMNYKMMLWKTVT